MAKGDRWHQLASVVLRVVLERGEMNQKDFAEYLRASGVEPAVTGAELPSVADDAKSEHDGLPSSEKAESPSVQDALRHQLRRGSVTLTTLLRAIRITETTPPDTWKKLHKEVSAEFAQEVIARSKMTNVLNLGANLSFDQVVAELGAAASEDTKVKKASGQPTLDDLFNSSLYYLTWAQSVMLRELEKTGNDFDVLAEIMRIETASSVTAKTLRKAFDDGDIKLAVFLQWLYSTRSHSLQTFVEFHKLESAAQLAQKNRSEQKHSSPSEKSRPSRPKSAAKRSKT